MDVDIEVPKGNKDGGWGWIVVIGTLYNISMYAACTRCYSVFFLPLMQEFSLDYVSVAWLSVSFMVAVGIFCPISPIVLRKFGVRPTVLVCGFIAGASCFTASLMPEFWQIQLFMGSVSGACFAFISTGSQTMVTRYFDKLLYRAMMFVSLGWSFGPFAMCLIYQWSIDYFGWRGAIQIVAGFCLNVMVAAALMKPIEEKKPNEATAIQVNDYMTPVLVDGRRRRSSVYEVASAFARNANLKIFKDIRFYFYMLAWNGFSRSYYTLMIFLIPYAQKDLGFDKMLASSLISAIAVGELIAKFGLALVMDKISGNGRMYFLAANFTAIAMELIVFAQLTSYTALMIACVILGMLGGGMNGIFTALIVSLFSVELFPSIYAFSGFIVHLVGGVITLLIGYIMDVAGFKMAFYIGAVMAMTSVPSILLIMFVDNKRKRSQ